MANLIPRKTRAGPATHFNNQVLTALACAAFLLSAAPVSAQPRVSTVRQVVVHFGDLDVTREAGARVLLSRLGAAARKACGGSFLDIRDLTAAADYHSCFEESMQRAVVAVDRPLVSELYDNANPAPRIIAVK